MVLYNLFHKAVITAVYACYIIRAVLETKEVASLDLQSAAAGNE